MNCAPPAEAQLERILYDAIDVWQFDIVTLDVGSFIVQITDRSVAGLTKSARCVKNHRWLKLSVWLHAHIGFAKLVWGDY